MQKVYQLLRNNKQSGPFTLEELKAHHIVASDLIWIEGKSAAWQFAHEIEALQTETTNTDTRPVVKPISNQTQQGRLQQPASKEKKVFVSLPHGQKQKIERPHSSPADALEQKAEALRQRLQTFAQPQQEAEKPETGLVRSLAEVQQENLRWASQQKQQKKKEQNQKRLIAALPIIILLLAGVYFMGQKKESASVVNEEKQVAGFSERNEPETKFDVPEALITTPLADNGEPLNTVAIKKEKKNAEQQPTTNTIAVNRQEHQAPLPAAEEVIAETNPTKMENETGTAPPQKEKKTIGEALDQFFGKFKKGKEEGAETNPAQNESNGVRTATKRKDGQEIQRTPVEAAKVSVKATEPTQDWMLGIRGVKLSLHNQNAQPLSSAEVEVSYFDEQNALLDKKTVTFRNVPGNKTVTQQAPDHRMASSISYQLVSVH